jgi:AcrR family transcriptional regulator
LLALVAERGYERTSVRVLTVRAAVGRSTFYEHFRDKDAVLASRLARLASVLRAATTDPAVPFAFVEPLVAHASAHRALGVRLRRSATGALLLARFTGLVRSLVTAELARLYPNASRTDLDFATEHVTGGLGALLEAEARPPRPREPHAVALGFRRLVLPGLAAWLGPPRPPT